MRRCPIIGSTFHWSKFDYVQGSDAGYVGRALRHGTVESKEGGPPRHLHHNEDELFYSMEGEYVVEIGSERFHLKSGDCVLGLREIPHAWAFAGGSPGRLLISFAPAGKMEAFFNERENSESSLVPTALVPDAALLHAFGMELIGPPLVVE